MSTGFAAAEHLRVARFLFAGAFAAGANIASRFAFSLWLPYSWAVTCAFFVGLATGFVTMRTLVFDGRGKPVVGQAFRYCVVNAFALLQTLVISLVLAHWALPAVGMAAHAEAIAHVIGVAVPIFTSYLGHRLVTFR
ncbi:MAG: GtrA family protein [Burkholderiales bacterium]|nr:GtrA family protein [Burkholderiales bacterium]